MRGVTFVRIPILHNRVTTLCLEKHDIILEQNPLHLVAHINEIHPHKSCSAAKMKDQIHQRMNESVVCLKLATLFNIG